MGSILGSKGNKQSSSSGTTPGFTEQLGASLAERQKSFGQYSKQSAIEDVQGVLKTQALDALQQVMPSIASSQIQSGMYDTTGKELLRNDASARIVGQLANTQLGAIKDYAAIEQGDINAFSNATKANTSVSSSGSSKGGGSGLLGLFADGGKVPEPVSATAKLTGENSESSPVNQLIDQLQSVFETQGPSIEERVASAVKPSSDDGFVEGMMKGAAQQTQAVSNSLSQLDKLVDNFVEDKVIGGAASLFGFSDGGKVPEKEKEKEKSAVERLKELFPNNIWDKSREKREKEAGLKGYADGGKVPSGITPGKVADHTQLLEAIRHHANGGVVRSGEEDVQAGGKIQGPETKSGEDNQVIAVGGGEGIIAADVMKVPGVEELVNMLNDQFHTPT